MSELVRFGVSLPEDLLQRFDDLIRRKNYGNRSEALRDLIRQELVKREWEEDTPIAGAITLVYDHHRRSLLSTVTDIQHSFQEIIISTQHVHLDHHNCLEIIAVRGLSSAVQRLADALKAVKGVKHGTISMTSTGKAIE
jgi:CopG family nickel-responsive transcriptional regulator